MSSGKRPKVNRAEALKSLRGTIETLGEVGESDDLQPALDEVATALRQVFSFPVEVRSGQLDMLLGYLETEGLGANVSELATFNALTDAENAEDYDDPPIDTDALQVLVGGLQELAEKLEA